MLSFLKDPHWNSLLQKKIQKPHRDDAQVDVLHGERVGTGALQEGKGWVVLFHRLINPAHGLHWLHSAGDHHGTTWGHERVKTSRLVLNIFNSTPSWESVYVCAISLILDHFYTFLGGLLQVGNVVGVCWGNFEEGHVDFMQKLYSHLREKLLCFNF